jgi:anti-anti-sigma factor
MPVSTIAEGDIVTLTPSRVGDPNPDRVIILAREEIRKLIGDSTRKVIVDCTGLDFLSSTEVGAMIGAIREISQVQGGIIFTGIGVRLAEIFEVMRILEVLPIRLTTREAQLELMRVKKETNLVAKLAAANPTLAQIHAWSDGQMAQRQQLNVIPEKPVQAFPKGEMPAVRPEDEETLMGRRAVHTDLSRPEIVQEDPWKQALQIIQSAQALCENQGLEFKPTMSFQDLLGNLSLKIPNRKE